MADPIRSLPRGWLAQAEVTTDELAAGSVRPGDQGVRVYNDTGSNIAADQLVYISGWDATNSLPEITLADADAQGRYAQYVTTAAIANGAAGVVYRSAMSAATLNTNSASAVGDPVYLHTTAGEWSLTAPTNASACQQIVGRVAVKSATVGQIYWNLESAVVPHRIGGINGVIDGSVGSATLAAGTLAANATGRAIMAADFFNAATADDKFAADAIGEDLLTANELNGRVVANVAAGNVVGGIPVVHVFTIPDGASGDVDITLTHKTRVIDAWVVLTAAGNVGNTYTVKNGATAITDAFVSAGGDRDIGRAGEIDDAQHEVAAAGTLRVSYARAGGSSAAIVYVSGLRVA
jgi:hypothetical protein